MTDYIDIDESVAKQRLADLEWVGAGKKPLYSQIMVGYMLARAVWFFSLFIDKAISCIDQGVIDMNADGTPTSSLEACDIKSMLYELKGLVYEKEVIIHEILSQRIKAKGYGDVTNAIFKYLGIGVVIKP